MIESSFVGMLLSLALGAIVGTQREMRLQQNKKKDFAGFRTYSFISLFGFMMAYLAINEFNSSAIILVGFIGVFLFSLLAYQSLVKIDSKNISIISEISAVLTFVVGVLVALQNYHLAITLSLFMTIVLLIGEKLHVFAKHLTNTEVFASIKFALISFVILPFLPNVNYTLLDIPYISDLLLNFSWVSKQMLLELDVFNPYKIWFMVVFISGISFVGYILMKIFGAKKGISLTGFLGGLMSSTGATTSFAIESKRLNYLSSPLAVGTTLACSTMFFRILFEVLVLNKSLLNFLWIPMVVMGMIGYIGAWYVYKNAKTDHVKKIDTTSPFAILPALQFAGFFLLILFLSKLSVILFGSKGIYLLAFFSGLTDVDAIVISLSTLALKGTISLHVATTGIFIAAFSNTIVKAGIAYSLGSKKFSKIIFILFGILLFFGVISFMFI